MYLRVVCTLVLSLQLIHISTCDKNDTKEIKSKRNIYHLGDGLNYNILPVHHLTRFTQVRSLTNDPSQVDITYKSIENLKTDKPLLEQQYPTQDYQFSETIGYPSDHINLNGHIYQAQPQHLQNFNGQQHITVQPQHFGVQGIPRLGAEHPLAAPHNQLVPPHYPLALQPRLAQYSLYGADKAAPAQAAAIRAASESKLPEYAESYTTIPVIYGQSNGNSPSLKYIQPTPHTQYNVPAQFNSLPVQNHQLPHHQAHQHYQHLKLPSKLQTIPLHHQRPHPHRHPQQHSPLYQINENFKAIHPKFFQPQVFEHPIVSQIQHFLPQVKNPFDAFVRPITQAPLVTPRPVQAEPPPEKAEPTEKPHRNNSEDDEDDDDDEDSRRHVKEEIQGELVHEEINDEEKFERGYDDAARGFPAYGDKGDRDEDYRSARYHHEDDSGHYRSPQYDDEDDHDYRRDPEHYVSHHDYEDERPVRYYHDSDHEAHYSQKNHRHEIKDRPRDRPPRPSKHHNSKKYPEETKKYYKHKDSEYPPSKRPVKSGKYYKATYSSSRKPHGDARHVASSPRKQSTKAKPAAKAAASTRSEVELTKPNYQYGFEPIKNPSFGGSKAKPVEDSEAKHSSPSSSKKLYKENWYISKTSET